MYDPLICRFTITDMKIEPLKKQAFASTPRKHLELQLNWRSCHLVLGKMRAQISLSDEEREYLISMATTDFKVGTIEAGILEKIKQAFKTVTKKAVGLLVGLMLFTTVAKGGTALDKKAGEMADLYKKFATEQTYSEVKVDHKILKDGPNLKVVMWTFTDAEGKKGTIKLTLSQDLKDMEFGGEKGLDAGVYGLVQTIAEGLKGQIVNQ